MIGVALKSCKTFDATCTVLAMLITPEVSGGLLSSLESEGVVVVVEVMPLGTAVPSDVDFFIPFEDSKGIVASFDLDPDFELSLEVCKADDLSL